MELKYMDKVKIMSGFYEGIIGHVTEIDRKLDGNYIPTYNKYLFKGKKLIEDNIDYVEFTTWIAENNLELVKDGK